MGGWYKECNTSWTVSVDGLEISLCVNEFNVNSKVFNSTVLITIWQHWQEQKGEHRSSSECECESWCSFETFSNSTSCFSQDNIASLHVIKDKEKI